MGINTEPGKSKKNVYDLFRLLVRTAPFTSEDDKREYLTLIDEMQAINMFGTMAEQIQTKGDIKNV